MNRIIIVVALSLACAPAPAQDNDAPAPADTAPPPPSADCTTLDRNTNRQQQDNLDNNSGTPSAPGLARRGSRHHRRQRHAHADSAQRFAERR